jgi:hypothetical protein
VFERRSGIDSLSRTGLSEKTRKKIKGCFPNSAEMDLNPKNDAILFFLQTRTVGIEKCHNRAKRQCEPMALDHASDVYVASIYP